MRGADAGRDAAPGKKCRGKIKFTTREIGAICNGASRRGGTDGRRMKAVAASGV